MSLNPATANVARRFLLKIVLLVFFSGAQSATTWGSVKAFATMSVLSALGCATLALMHAERPASRFLTYWDEAAAFLTVAAAVTYLT